MDRRIFHVDLDAFFVSVERALDPALEGKPVVVGGEPGARGVVACASYEARAYGLHAGMPISQAQRLCPHAAYLKGRFARYQEVSRQFMAILAGYTPLFEPMGIDEAYLDMTGFDGLYGPLTGVAMDIKTRVLAELGITASVGIAGSKVTAKVASDLCKPNGLLEIPVGGEALFLAPLPIEKLPGVGEKTTRVLKERRITTIGELAQVPPSALRRLLGAWGDILNLRAKGEDRSPVSAPAPAKSISRETTFYRDTLDMDFLSGTLRYLSERVGAHLRKEGKVARQVALKLRYGDFQTVSRHHTLLRPTDGDDDTFTAGLTLMKKALGQRRAPVRLIGIGVAELTPRASQLSFLDTRLGKGHDLVVALDAIRGKYGFTSIQRGLTFSLDSHFQVEDGEYLLKTSALSR
ncbi:MAG: DNA polymerase IV [Chloroflexi bacterium]|nr:DNA polymerase IV [Chloroflexota bacterium]